MSTLHDIYDPPPAPLAYAPPEPEPIGRSRGDLFVLAGLIGLVILGSAWAWTIDPEIAAFAMVGGAIVMVESWSTALAFLHRRPWMGLGGRWKIFLAALVPWLVGVGGATGLMIGLFRLYDWLS